jgi:hypothetical protein
MKLKCTLTGKHKWDTPIDSVPDSAFFYRVDCQDCDYSVDGVQLKEVIELIKSSEPGMARRLKGRS